MFISEYKYNESLENEQIKDIIEEYEGIDKSIIDVIYMEGNKDNDPYEGVIDSGCPKTVAGKAWIDAFIESKQDRVTRN